MRRSWLLMSLIVWPLAAASCGDGGGESGDSAPSCVFLSLGTAPLGGRFFVIGSALAEVLNEFGSAFGWTTTAEATAGSQENVRRLDSGELDFSNTHGGLRPKRHHPDRRG